MNVRIMASADVDPTATVGDGSSVWHLAQVRDGATIGESCVIGRGAYIGSGVSVGDNCKVQNYALVYEPAVLEPGVFVGPAAVLTNDEFPRAVNPDGTPKSAHDWQAVGVTLREGASVGARAVCIAPVTVGRWATVAAERSSRRTSRTTRWSQGCRHVGSSGSAAPASRCRTKEMARTSAPPRASGTTSTRVC